MECCTPTVARLIHASIVNGVVMFRLALEGTETDWLVPLNWSAKFGAPLGFAMNTAALVGGSRTKPAGAIRDSVTVRVGLTSASGMGVTVTSTEFDPAGSTTELDRVV